MATHYDVAPGFSRKVGAARAAYWFQIDTIEDVVATVEGQNLDTVEGCRDALATIHGARRVKGRELFTMANPGTQFPDGWDDFYVTTMDDEFGRVFNALHRALEYRDTNIAKDTQAGRQQGAPATGVTTERTTQSLQDNRKAIQELINKVRSIALDPLKIWSRSRFERELGLSWV